MNEQSILSQLIDQKLQLWVVTKGDRPVAAVVTEILVYGVTGYKVCIIYLCGGETRADWIDQLPQVEAWARETGCNEIEEWGRRGWGRDMAAMGYKQRLEVWSKKL